MLVAGEGLGQDVTNGAAARPQSAPPGMEDGGESRREGKGRKGERP